MAGLDNRPNHLVTLLGKLAEERPDLGLVTSDAESGFVPLAAIPPLMLDRWLAATATLAEGIDDRTAAAYLLSILVWKLGEVLAALHLGGSALNLHIAVRHTVSGSGRSSDVQFQFAISRGEASEQLPDRRSANRAITALHEPLVTALHERTGLSRRALWRLVTDGIAGGFLERGKRAGGADHARAEAEALLSFPDSPLHNRQWRFVRIEADGGPAEWFRLRGGCCRLYRSVGESYCTTCVVRPADEQIERLSAFVARIRTS